MNGGTLTGGGEGGRPHYNCSSAGGINYRG
jgi:hypothetical protein